MHTSNATLFIDMTSWTIKRLNEVNNVYLNVCRKKANCTSLVGKHLVIVKTDITMSGEEFVETFFNTGINNTLVVLKKYEVFQRVTVRYV